MKKFNKLIIFGILVLILQGCGSVKKAFDSERKNSSEEFLVEKKSPLSMPPDFSKLPVPDNLNKDNDEVENDNNIEKLINNNKTESKEKDQISTQNLENLLIEKIKNN